MIYIVIVILLAMHGKINSNRKSSHDISSNLPYGFSLLLISLFRFKTVLETSKKKILEHQEENRKLMEYSNKL